MCNTGDADGLGETRKKELIKSGLQLGIRSKEDILIIEDKYSSPATTWW
jgi:N-acetylglucosaminylphosphatidylinositol deacetylase